MRYTLNKKQSTKPERIVYEILKELRIPFRHRWLVNNREVDFILGNVAIEINGHPQDVEKNRMLANSGYLPIHFSNKEILENKEIVKKQIKEIWQNQQDIQKF